MAGASNMSEEAIYLDFNATTPVDEAVLQAMLPWLGKSFGNPASQHVRGAAAARAVETARGHLATLIGCASNEVVFTSGATEANNLALKGVVACAEAGRNRVVVAETEHKSVLDTADWLGHEGVAVDLVPVGRDGAVDPADVARLMGPDVVLVSVMLANNETGVVSDVEEIAAIARDVGAIVHTDATQALGKIAVDVRSLGVDLASFSAHKVYGPQGVGALYVRRRTALAPLFHGGGHERGIRSGTLNVPGIVGFGAAAVAAAERGTMDAARSRELVDLLRSRLTAAFPSLQAVVRTHAENGPATLPNTFTARFPGADAEAIMTNAPYVAVSTGSACTSLVPSPSHVLTAILGDADAAAECIRFSVGRPTTEDDVIRAAAEIARSALRVSAATAGGTAWSKT